MWAFKHRYWNQTFQQRHWQRRCWSGEFQWNHKPSSSLADQWFELWGCRDHGAIGPLYYVLQCAKWDWKPSSNWGHWPLQIGIDLQAPVPDLHPRTQEWRPNFWTKHRGSLAEVSNWDYRAQVSHWKQEFNPKGLSLPQVRFSILDLLTATRRKEPCYPETWSI